MSEIVFTGERQLGKKIEDIREDHLARYNWVSNKLAFDNTVLDAGCGVGYGSNILANKVKKVCSVEVDSDVISFAKENWSKENIEFIEGDLYYPPLSSSAIFDVVVAFEVIEHLISPELFLTKIKKNLKVNSKIYLSVPNENVVSFSIERNPFHIRHYTPETIEGILDGCGYKVIAIYSQENEVIKSDDGYSGKFLIVEAELKYLDIDSNIIESMERSIILNSHKLLHDRSTALTESKRRILKLKKRLTTLNEPILESNPLEKRVEMLELLCKAIVSGKS
jgi:SAM-dependent methyltransferase